MTKTIFVTGGSRGIGEAIVRLAAGAYNVAFTYFRSEGRAQALQRELGAGVLGISCDVRSCSSVQEAVDRAKVRFGRIDVLVNNAGISHSGLLIDMTAEQWRDVMATNLDGAFYATKAVLPGMLSQGGGAIVNISSVWGSQGASCEAAYSASKAGLIGLTKALAKEVAPMGVTVNAIAPGAVDTDMMRDYTADEVSALISDRIPLGRLATPTEVARAALFLAEHPYITGATLSVDGGM